MDTMEYVLFSSRQTGGSPFQEVRFHKGQMVLVSSFFNEDFCLVQKHQKSLLRAMSYLTNTVWRVEGSK